MWYILTMEYYAALQRNKILLHVIAWMKLKDIMLNEIKPITTQILYDSIYMRYLNYSNS